MNAVLFTEIVLDKLRGEQYDSHFLALTNQKQALVALVSRALNNLRFPNYCDSSRSPQDLMHHILSAAANTLLNTLCEMVNSQLGTRKGGGSRKQQMTK
ncbi:hypothetical protein HPB48_009964 [Haemaphysalis longicornis]|uniref:Uncharacterized protein n=1 Tax=Haemaphysalis longicornis TaxID=44386 RepID=A0A9J6FZ10_HAELO|nr:hypothetical protein HPB48_009964 [Haemaphysalis longicornis]